MKLHYTTRQIEVPEALKKKLETRFQKIHKILGDRHDPEAHLILSLERRLYNAEVTVHLRQHTMVVECSGPDLPGVLLESADKLEKQIIRNKDRWRERKRRPKPEWEAPAETAAPDGRRGKSAPFTPRVFRTFRPLPKPLTVEEAVLEMQQDDRDCVVYRDADKGGLSVLFRRRDGHLELVEG
jgi:putative sigma-54 modulation protein